MNTRRFSRSRGLTLIELLVAVLILAILGVMCWRAINASLDSRDHILEVQHRWQKLSRGFSLIEHNLLQTAERASTAPGTIPDFQLQKLENGDQRLVFWRMDPVQGARLTGFRVENDQLQLLRWPHNVPVTSVAGQLKVESIIDGAHKVRWAVLNSQGDWVDAWAGGVPNGIRLDMDIDGVGHVQRLFAFR